MEAKDLVKLALMEQKLNQHITESMEQAKLQDEWRKATSAQLNTLCMDKAKLGGILVGVSAVVSFVWIAIGAGIAYFQGVPK